MVIYGKQAIEMPKKGKNIFRYADFEAITEKVQGCQPKDNKLFTESYQKHTDCVYDVTDETSNWLGLCDIYYVFYRLLSTTYLRKLVY